MPATIQEPETKKVRVRRMVVARADFFKDPAKYARKATSTRLIVVKDPTGKVCLTIGGPV